YIARHTKELALAVVDAGAVPLLVLCFQEPELTLKRMSASALADIAKHTPELAQTVVDAGGVSLIARELGHADSGLKRQVCSCLGQVAKHNVDLAEVVVEAEVFPRILHCLKDVNEHV
ncbi:Sperm-associated antigen 6, partial [Perkinsus olseni]